MLRVVEAYVATYPDPIRVSAGDALTVGRADDENPAWVWCTGPRGREGWMPRAWIEGATAARDYSAVELDVSVGESLDLLEQHAGWRRCRAADGAEGWLPVAAAVSAEEPWKSADEAGGSIR